jgi:hypothetical protein
VEPALTCVFLLHYTGPVSAAAIRLAYRTPSGNDDSLQ